MKVRTLAFELALVMGGLGIPVAQASVPVISNLAASNSAVGRATVYGSLTSTGDTVTTVFLLYGTSSSALTATNLVGVQGIGTVSNALVTLSMGTAYYYQFAATNADGWGYAPTTNTFTTLGPIRLTNDCDVVGGAALRGSNVLNGGTMSIANLGGSGTAASPWAYTVPGLDLAAYKLISSTGECFALDLCGSNVVGSGVNSFFTFRTGNGKAIGSVTVTNVGSVSAGIVDLHQDDPMHQSSGGGVDNPAGSLAVGSVSNPAAGAVRLDAINTSAINGAGGNVAIYGAGDVLIRTAGGTPGPINTSLYRAYPNDSRAGSVSILHRGVFVAGTIQAMAVSSLGNYTAGNAVTLRGNYGGGAAIGSCSVGDILTYGSGGAGGYGGNVTIVGYTAVTVSNVWSYNIATTYGRYAPGNIVITNISGHVLILGTINANSLSGTDGTVTLQTSPGSGGNITVSNLDLSAMQYASFAPDGAGYINGALLGTNGVAATPGTVTNALRIPAGKAIWYASKANPGLNNQILQVRALSGAAGGGTLRPSEVRGTVLTVE